MDAGCRSFGPVTIAALAMFLLVGFAAPLLSSTPSRATRVPSGDTTRPPSPPKDVTYSKDRAYYSSPWYDGAWQEMVPFGCTEAPYYPRDLSCPRSKPGRHHGIDMFMVCGTKVRSAVNGFVVLNPNLGTAYGRLGLKIRSKNFDYVLGHLRRLYVQPGQHVHAGQLIARSGKLAAPDGCHLHVEKRPNGLGYTAAVNPLKSLRRTVVSFPKSSLAKQTHLNGYEDTMACTGSAVQIESLPEPLEKDLSRAATSSRTTADERDPRRIDTNAPRVRSPVQGPKHARVE